MFRFIIPLLILLGSLLYSCFWNSIRKPECESCKSDSLAVVATPTPQISDSATAINVDTTQLTVEEKVLFQPLEINFASAQFTIPHTAKVDTFLHTAKKYLLANPAEKLSITGHTDSDGTDETNMTLSKKRATRVKDLLIKDGFKATQLEIFAKGETEPLATNDTPENKAKNRRVSVQLLK